MHAEREEAWQLLTRLLAYEPESRPSAAEALIGRYLNSDCAAGEVPTTAPAPWTLRALVLAAGARQPERLAADECAVPPDLGI